MLQINETKEIRSYSLETLCRFVLYKENSTIAMKTKTPCQVCKKREAYKKLVSSIDGSFFVVCKKRKCIKELYEKFEDHVTSVAKTQKEFVNAVRWDRMENQGRTYRQAKTNRLAMEFPLILLIAAMACLSMYGLFRLLFHF